MPKVYRFYLDLEKSDRYERHSVREQTIDRRYPLYAWTSNKKYADKFRKTRNMDIFVERVSKMSKDELVKFGNKKRTSELDKCMFIAFRSGEWENVNMIATWQEKDMVSDMVDTGLCHPELTPVDYNLFKQKYIKALKTITYTVHFDLNVGVNEDYDFPDMMMDELALFIHEAGHTFHETK